MKRNALWISCLLASIVGLPALAQMTPAQMTPKDAPLAAKPAPNVKPNYALAARFMPEEVNQLVFDTAVNPHWFTHSDRFWYSYRTTAGTGYFLVDPATKSRKPLWDNVRLAERLSLLTNLPYDAQHLDLENVELVENDAAIRFSVAVRKDARLPDDAASQDASLEASNQTASTRYVYFRYDLASGDLRRLDGYKSEVQPLWATVSPDNQTILFARGENLYTMDAANYAKALRDPADPSIVETQLTTDGVAKYSYAAPRVPEEQDALKKIDRKDVDNPKGMRVPAIAIHWSQDGTRFAFVREDDRKVADLWVIHSLASPRPELETYSYALPGEANVPIQEIQIFTLATRQRVVVPSKNFPLNDPMVAISDAPATNADRERAAAVARSRSGLGLQGVGGGRGGSSRWLASGSDKLYLTSFGRDYRNYDLCAIDTATGAVTTLIRESSNDWLDPDPSGFGRAEGMNPLLADHGRQIIWWSQRDGWDHYYRYDTSGKLLNPITSGPYMSNRPVAIDDTAGQLYFLADGHDPHIDPRYLHLFRVGLDGAGLTDLTPGDFNTGADASDDGKFFVTNSSRVNTAPVSQLVDDQGASTPLETADVSRLLAAGYRYPEPFTVKAADGITDLYGVMYKPFDFDPSRKYPIIEFVYPGPQTEEVSVNFTPKSPSIPLAQMGFIVIEVANRGATPLRDKWYDAYGYGNMRDYGLADIRQAVLELAERFPCVDASRVGIWGHSGGGFMTAAALLQYPTFYTAGWSESGNHDNNVYDKNWSEKYDGVRQQKEADGAIQFIYDIEKNSDLAANLRGHLMVTTGDMDNNVSMANTMRLANALIHANKRFEMLMFPGMRHPYTPINDYVLVRRMDFFAQWLLGSSDTDPDILLLQNEKIHTPGKKFIE